MMRMLEYTPNMQNMRPDTQRTMQHKTHFRTCYFNLTMQTSVSRSNLPTELFHTRKNVYVTPNKILIYSYEDKKLCHK
jgi:hypothetical protein